MTWVSPPAYSVGQVLTATLMNNVSGDFNFLYNGSLVPIYDTTVTGSSVASVDITGIPATWAHLLVVASVQSASVTNSDNFYVRANADAGANYDFNTLEGSNSATTDAGGFASTNGMNCVTIPGANFSTKQGSVLAYLPNYNKTTLQKSMIAVGGFAGTAIASSFSDVVVSTWRSTAAINELTFRAASGNLVIGSRITLYGMGVPT